MKHNQFGFGAIAILAGSVGNLMFAKSGTITSPSGADEAMRDAVSASDPKVGTLANVARAAFEESSLEKIAIINLANRTVTIVPAGTNIAAVTGAAGLELASIVTKDDPTKGSSPMTGTDEGGADSDAIVALDLPVKPSRSVESKANELEDAIAAIDGRSGIVVIDQAAANISVFTGATAAVQAVNAAAALAEDAQFVQTLTQSGGAQFGE